MQQIVIPDGIEASFTAMYERERKRVYYYLLHAVRDHDTAEDLCTDVFLTALRKNNWEDRGAWAHVPYHHWLIRVASYRVWAHRTAERNRKIVSIEARHDDTDALPIDYDPALIDESTVRIYDLIDNAMTFAFVRAAIPKLPDGSMMRRNRQWHAKDVQRLIDLIDTGMPPDDIAWQLNRTKTAIQVKIKRLKISPRQRGTTMMAREVARLLGVGCSKIIRKWVQLGWLRAAVHSTPEAPWRFRWEDVETFLQCPNYWMAWHPERIASPTLRTHMVALRAGQPRWLTPGEVAQRYCVGHQQVNAWIHKGVLQATKYGNWWINERTLETFVAPSSEEASVARRTRLLAERESIRHALAVYTATCVPSPLADVYEQRLRAQLVDVNRRLQSRIAY